MSVLSFRPPKAGELTIPTPLNYSPTADYITATLHDDTLKPIGIAEGAVAVAQVGLFINGHIHLVEFGASYFLGVVTLLGDNLVSFTSSHSHHLHSGVYEAGQLNVVGALTCSFPLGVPGPMWVFDPPAGADDRATRPLIRVSAR